LSRFPEDFMFQLTAEDAKSLRFQIGTSKKGRGGSRYLPYGFTEQGIAMLSGVLNSPRAIQANIQIMRTFTRLRELLATNELIRQKIEELEKKCERHDKQFRIVFDAIKELLDAPRPKQKKPVGFHVRY
jgi:adenylyl- and sulfurtransferase ThiI